MVRTNTTFILFVIALVALSSCAKLSIKDGMQAYQEIRYRDAITHLEKGLSKVDDIEARKALADAYLRTNQFEKAAETYGMVISSPEVEDVDRIAYGRALMASGNYKEAESVFDALLSRDPGNQEAQALRSSCKRADEIKADSARYEVKTLSIPSLNAAYAPYVNGNRVYFSGEKPGAGEEDQYTGLKYTDLYSAVIMGDSFTQIEKVSGVNDKYHDGIAVVSKDGKTMILTRSNYERKSRLQGNDDNVATTQLYSSEMNSEGKWGTPKRLSFSEDKFMFAHPALSSDGNTLYFSSDMSGGYGGMDLFKTTRTEEGWSKPENLGAAINTAGNEVFPSLRSDDSLYFSSNAHQTLGGLDLMYAVNQQGDWNGPFHLAYPLNSAHDDFGIAFSNEKKSGYFSSDRYGMDKIFSYTESDLSFVLKGLVTSSNSGDPIENATIIITNLTDGTEETLQSDDVGMFELDMIPGKNYRVRAEKDGFFSVNEDVSTQDKNSSETINLNLELLSLSNPDGTAQDGNGDGTDQKEDGIDYPDGVDSNQPYEIPNIFWDYNEWDIREDAKPYLNYLAKLLKDNPDLKVEISSHCDCRGGDFFNQQLSKKRANAASDYLVKKGVRRAMLISKGYGEEQLVNNCDCSEGRDCTEAQHQKNRRTEFKVLGE